MRLFFLKFLLRVRQITSFKYNTMPLLRWMTLALSGSYADDSISSTSFSLSLLFSFSSLFYVPDSSVPLIKEELPPDKRLPFERPSSLPSPRIPYIPDTSNTTSIISDYSSTAWMKPWTIWSPIFMPRSKSVLHSQLLQRHTVSCQLPH